MNFIPIIVAFIISDTVAAIICAYILFRYRDTSKSFIRRIAYVMGAYGVEQILTLIAIAVDHVQTKRSISYGIIIVLGRTLRSAAIWRFTATLLPDLQKSKD